MPIEAHVQLECPAKKSNPNPYTLVLASSGLNRRDEVAALARESPFQHPLSPTCRRGLKKERNGVLGGLRSGRVAQETLATPSNNEGDFLIPLSKQ